MQLLIILEATNLIGSAQEWCIKNWKTLLPVVFVWKSYVNLVNVIIVVKCSAKTVFRDGIKAALTNVLDYLELDQALIFYKSLFTFWKLIVRTAPKKFFFLWFMNMKSGVEKTSALTNNAKLFSSTEPVKNSNWLKNLPKVSLQWKKRSKSIKKVIKLIEAKNKKLKRKKKTQTKIKN